MNINKSYLRKAGEFLAFVIGFWVISALYLSPTFDDKVLQQGDMQQTRLMRYQSDKYLETHGARPGWYDGMFSGMPANLITGIPTGNLVYLSGVIEMFHTVGTPVNFLFVAMLAMFIMLLSADINRWFAAAGAIGYAFMTYSVTSYEAGHITKVLAMAAMPGVLGGLLLIARRKYMLGGAVAGVFFALLVGYFHYQIAYYCGIVAFVFVAVQMLVSLKQKDTRHALMTGVLSAAVLAAGALSNIGKMVDTSQYAKATMRGGSELASEVPKNGPKQDVSKSGLDIEYAFSWSYSPQESFSLLVPRFVGGSSGEDIGENEVTGEQRFPLYWGDLSFTSGPIYLGAIFIFLFVLAFFVVVNIRRYNPEHPQANLMNGFMWFSAITTLISILLAMGRFFPLNNLLFEYLPYYNKFRTPMMALAIAQVTVPFFGLYGLSLLLNSGLTKDQLKTVLKHGAIAIGIVLGIAALVLFMADFSAPGDKELVKNNYPIEKIKSIRNSKAFGDLFRSFLLIGVSFGLIFMYLLKNGSKVMLMAGMVVLVAFDLIGVSKRYLKEDNWIDKQEEETIAASQKEQQLMKFNTNHARVFDLRYNPFNDAHSAPWFRGIGGYHPAKLSRYQDLISYCITPNGGQLSFDGIMKNNALDMLNCGYVLTPGKESRDPNGFDVIPRTTALGNAWFVQKIVTVSSAKEAIETINKFKPSEEAVVEAKATAKPASATYSKDSTSAIVVTYYSYDTIEYKSKNAGPGFGVFSEIYYNQKNANWEASIDGKPATVLQVNYMLRGLEIPAGEHKIKFVYKSNSNPYINVERASSGILLLLLLVSLGKGITGKQESESGDA